MRIYSSPIKFYTFKWDHSLYVEFTGRYISEICLSLKFSIGQSKNYLVLIDYEGSVIFRNYRLIFFWLDFYNKKPTANVSLLRISGSKFSN